MGPKRWAIGLLVVVAGGAAIQSPPDEAQRHQGTWAVVRFEREGQVTGAEVLGQIIREVDGDHIVWRRDGRRFAGTRFTVDPTREPNELDLIPDGGPSRGERVLAIYEFRPDGTLRICVADPGRPRPTAFESPEGSGWTVQEFRRR